VALGPRILIVTQTPQTTASSSVSRSRSHTPAKEPSAQSENGFPREMSAAATFLLAFTTSS
jgi:hypothetical protein